MEGTNKTSLMKEVIRYMKAIIMLVSLLLNRFKIFPKYIFLNISYKLKIREADALNFR